MPPWLGRFELGALLGSGAFGEVYAASERATGERVALKILKRASPDAIARFKREFRALRDLTHPNLIGLFELGGDDDAWFFTMELIDGVDVTTWLGGGAAARATVASGDDAPAAPVAPAAIDPRRLARVLAQLADALDAVHAAGRLHCDLKPNNILVDPDGVVRVCDFGLVADVGERSDLGTPWFMAPEQCARAPLSPAADWYAVGALLFELYAGRPPHVGDAASVRGRKAVEPAPAIAAVDASVPPAMAALIDGLLARDPAARPDSAAVRAVASALGGDAIAGPTRALREPPLVGRDRELAALDEAWAAAAAGPVVVRVIGASGIGKTALCRAWLARVPATTWVLAGRCYDREHMPFRAIDPIIDALAERLRALPAPQRAPLIGDDLAPLARLFPVLRGLAGASDDGAPGEARARALAAAQALLARVAAHTRVVLWLDDLQWSDPGSGALLAAILTGPNPPALLCLAGCRRDDADTSAVLAALRTHVPTARAIELEPLAPADGVALARALGRDRDAEAIADEAGGSPFLLRELARLDGPTGGATAIDDLVRARAAALPPTCRALLTTVAVAGGPIARRHAAAATPAAHRARADVHTLRAAGLVRTTARSTVDDDELDTYHDRVREAVLAGLAPAERRATHQRLADALAADGGDLERVVGHQRDAGDRAAALTTARAAAAQAATPDRAAALFALAAELADDADDRRALQVARGEALTLAGRGAAAAAAFAATAATATAHEAMVLRRRAAELLLRAGQQDAGAALLATVLAEHGLRLPQTSRAMVASLVWQRARLALRGARAAPRRRQPASPQELERVDALWALAGTLAMTDHLLGANLQARNLRAALDAGEPVRLARSLTMEAIYAATVGGRDRRKSQRLIDRATALAATTDDPLARAMIPLAEGVRAEQAGEWAHARARCAAAMTAIAAAPGAFFELANARRFWLKALVWLGELAEVEAAVPAFLDDARRRGDAYMLTVLRGGPASFRWVWRGEPGRALADVRAVAATLPPRYHVTHLTVMLAEVRALLALGDGGAAWARLERDRAALAGTFLLRTQNLLIDVTALRGNAALAAGRPDEARRCLARLRRERMPWGDALAALLEAGLAATPAAWQRAAAACAACDMAMHAAAARARAGGPATVHPAVIAAVAPSPG
ncbi:MAG: protein kinase [Myxococcales bacterium]|nr:protein kinase [Myxococcales bacterium]